MKSRYRTVFHPEPDALNTNVEKQCSIIPFSFLLGVWVRSQEVLILESYKQSLIIKPFLKEV